MASFSVAYFAQSSSQKHLKMSVSSHFICLVPAYKINCNKQPDLMYIQLLHIPFVFSYLSTIPALSISVSLYILCKGTPL